MLNDVVNQKTISKESTQGDASTTIVFLVSPKL